MIDLCLNRVGQGRFSLEIFIIIFNLWENLDNYEDEPLSTVGLLPEGKFFIAQTSSEGSV